jgi:hypothetical protein
MLQLKNSTRLKALMLLAPDPAGVESVFTIVKGTFALAPVVRLADEQLPLVLNDEFRSEPAKSSLKAASDVTLIKPGTDVLLLGTAYPPDGQPAPQADVTLSLGPVRKTVRVFGDRAWESGLLGARLTPPQPFERMPLVWERAFGGVDPGDGSRPQPQAEPRNPVGVGFRLKAGPKDVVGLKVPNLEDPKQLIARWQDRPTPAGFGPLGAHWEPRKTYAGSYDEAWQKKRAPYLPTDFNPRFFQAAPPDQVVPDYLKGGEPVEVVGATPAGRLAFRLPEVVVRVTYRLDDQDHARPANLDTVVIEPDAGRLLLTWRSAFSCDKKALRVRDIRVAATFAERRG